MEKNSKQDLHREQEKYERVLLPLVVAQTFVRGSSVRNAGRIVLRRALIGDFGFVYGFLAGTAHTEGYEAGYRRAIQDLVDILSGKFEIELGPRKAEQKCAK